jgi:hypothetical protein
MVATAHVIQTRLAGAFAMAVVGAPGAQESADPCFEELGDCPNSLDGGAGGVAWEAIAIGAAFLGVLVFGLRAIKRQRDEGRRSKLPPIG